MRMLSALLALFLGGSIAALSGAHRADGGQGRRSAGKPAEPVVTAVVGPSWLTHLNLTYRDSSLGRGAGRYGPPPSEPRPPGRDAVPSFATDQPVALTGLDLYRLNCQACHRAEGTGSPPEIKSILDLVQGSSFEFVRRQLQLEGAATSAATIRTRSQRGAKGTLPSNPGGRAADAATRALADGGYRPAL
jgi:hypothetical protein